MVSIMLVIENEKESQILKVAFEQRGIKVLVSKADYQNYIKTLQFLPDIIIIELPKPNMKQLHFAGLLKTHKKAKLIPIIGYGQPIDAQEKNGILHTGINTYLERPLKFSQLINLIENLLKLKNKKIEAKEQKEKDREKDIELLLAADTPPMKKIEIMTSYVSQLLAFPFTVAKVLSLAESTKSAASDLAKVIEADPVISTQILKLSNSVLFASLNRRISSIKDAIVRIGFKETKRLVMCMSVMKIFKEEDKNIGFNRIGFWYHSLASGIIAERLAKRMGTINTEEAFLAGLLHDFGIIILDEFFPDIFFKILEDTSNKAGLFIERETAILGINHNDIIKELFEKWKLPEIVRQGIILQYDVNSFKNSIDSQEKKCAVCVYMANNFAKSLILGKECDMYVEPIDNLLFSAVKLPSGFTQSFIDEISQEMKLYKEFLKIEVSETKSSSEKSAIENKKIGIVNIANDIFVPPLFYLEKNGVEVKQIKVSDSVSSYDGAFEAILIWAGNQSNAQDIIKYSKIIKYSDKPQDSNSNPAFAPLLVCVPVENKKISEEDSCKNFSFVYNVIDLRQYDKHLTSMFMGKKVLLSETEPPSPRSLLSKQSNKTENNMQPKSDSKTDKSASKEEKKQEKVSTENKK
jgi:HD-like signal output (HDOD) protein/ActR/RegA family two-component response regulator